MPGYAYTVTRIEGPVHEVQSCKALLTSAKRAFDLAMIVPVPEGVLPDVDWCVQHWGTKWNTFHSLLVEQGPGHLVYVYITAWDPPEEAHLRLSVRFPNLNIHFWSRRDTDPELMLDFEFMGGELFLHGYFELLTEQQLEEADLPGPGDDPLQDTVATQRRIQAWMEEAGRITGEQYWYPVSPSTSPFPEIPLETPPSTFPQADMDELPF